MNPVLLKPQSEIGAQIVVQGRVHGTAKAAAYQRHEAGAHAVRARQLRALKRRGRHRAGRRRRQRIGSQSARERHRQYGLCARRRCAGRPHRRHRPRRRHRQPRRHQSGDRCGRRRADSRLPRQQVSRRSGAVRGRHGDDRAGDRLAAARPRARSSPTPAAAGRGRARARRGAAVEAEGASAGSPCRSCRASPISTISIRSTPSPRSISCGAAGQRAARRRRPRHSAGLESDDRRSGGAARGRLGHRHRRPSCGAAAHVLGLCGGYQMLGRAIAIPHGIEGPAGIATASACSTSRPV